MTWHDAGKEPEVSLWHRRPLPPLHRGAETCRPAGGGKATDLPKAQCGIIAHEVFNTFAAQEAKFTADLNGTSKSRKWPALSIVEPPSTGLGRVTAEIALQRISPIDRCMMRYADAQRR